MDPRRDKLLHQIAEKVEPSHSALLIIDMQNDFCSRGGFLDQIGIDVTGVQEIVPKVSRLIDAAHQKQVRVVYLRSHFDDEFLLPPMIERLERKKMPRYCLSGTWGAAFIDNLQPQAEDLIVTKHRYSGFFGTSLGQLLSDSGVQTVILAGTATNNCVDGTGRDAYYNGYYVVLLSDATAAPTPELHANALATADHAYASIATAKELLAAWEFE